MMKDIYEGRGVIDDLKKKFGEEKYKDIFEFLNQKKFIQRKDGVPYPKRPGITILALKPISWRLTSDGVEHYEAESEKYDDKPLNAYSSTSQATFKDGSINIELQKEIFDHVQKLLSDGHYFNAVEEAYKIVRQKLKNITGKEKATDAFDRSNYEKIFGHQSRNDAEKDFFEGVKFLHMAIQFLRNEKAHTPAGDMDKNLAIHYIALASLAYDMINRK